MRLDRAWPRPRQRRYHQGQEEKTQPINILPKGECCVWQGFSGRRLVQMDKPSPLLPYRRIWGLILSFEILAECLDTYTCLIEECKPRTFISSCWEKSVLERCHGQRAGKPQPASRHIAYPSCSRLRPFSPSPAASADTSGRRSNFSPRRCSAIKVSWSKMQRSSLRGLTDVLHRQTSAIIV